MIPPRLLTVAAMLTVFSACGEMPLEPRLDAPLQAATDRTVKMVPLEARHTSLPGDPSVVSCAAGQIPGRSVFSRGNSTLLGSYSGEGIACLIFTSPVTAVSASARIVMIAANGDEIRFDMDPANPQLWTVVFGPSGPVAEALGGFNAVGGTGRFEGVTGYITNFAQLDLAAGTAVATSSGTISSPGSIKWGSP